MQFLTHLKFWQLWHSRPSVFGRCSEHSAN